MPFSEPLRALIKGALEQRETVYFSAVGVPITFETQLVSCDEQGLIFKNAVQPHLIAQVMQASQYFLQVANLRLACAQLGSNGKDMIFPLLSTQTNEGNARTEQRRAFANQDQAICEILNPYDLQTILRRQVIDLSNSGMSLRSRYQSRLMSPPTAFSSLKVYVQGKLRMERTGRVIYNRQLMSLKGVPTYQTGIQFD